MILSVRSTRPSARVLERLTRGLDLRINFGSTTARNCLNEGYAVALASNKRRAREVLGVELYDHYPDFPVVGRPDHHRQGKNLYLCEGELSMQLAREQGATHFFRYVKGREFRVHIVNGKSIKLVEKLQGTGIIRNHDNGYFFGVTDLARKRPLRDASKLAVQKLGLDFGAVDIILDESTNEPFVLEVNTAPCLTDLTSNTASKYAEAFREYRYG